MSDRSRPARCRSRSRSRSVPGIAVLSAILLAAAAGCSDDPAPRAACPPGLIEPEPDAVMDNGRLDFQDEIVWRFVWEPCADASRYQLQAAGRAALMPAVDVEVSGTEFETRTRAYVAPQNAQDWYWRVRAEVDGKWSVWSEERSLSVEPVNSDPPETPGRRR